jgi:hypothetical protein
MPKSASQKSYQKALLLAIAFVVVLIIANSLLKFVSHPGNIFRPHMDGGIANFIELNTDEIALMRKKTAGFWQCNGVRGQQTPFLSVSDRIELKDNGIFWRVRCDVAHLPSGDSVDFITITNGYMQPYSRSKTCADSILCQVHFIGQVIIDGNDTCYLEHARMSDDPKKSVVPEILRTPQRQQGEVAADTAWDIIIKGKVFALEGRSYAPYDTAGAALYSFFPRGATKLVGKISVPPCANTVSMENSVKKALVHDMAGTSVESRTQENIVKTVNTYYRALFAENLAKRVTAYRKGSVTLSFSVNKHGTVSDPRIVDSKPFNIRLNEELKKELLTWTFPVCASQDKPVQATFAFAY